MNKKAFTLIELLVVISVLALLASIVFSNLGGAREGARISNALSFQSQTHSLLGSDLVGWWNMNECSGSEVRDLSGYENNGSFFNNPQWDPDSPGGQGCSLRFNGGDELRTGFNWNQMEEKTLSVWFKIDDWSSRGVLGSYIGGAGGGRMLYRNSGDLQGRMRWYVGYKRLDDTLTYFAPTWDVFELGKWHHFVAILRLNGTSEYYIDLTKNNRSAPSNFKAWDSVGSGNDPINIGTGSGISLTSWRFFGNVDDVRIYNRVLTASEIQTLYTQTKDKYLANE